MCIMRILHLAGTDICSVLERGLWGAFSRVRGWLAGCDMRLLLAPEKCLGPGRRGITDANTSLLKVESNSAARMTHMCLLAAPSLSLTPRRRLKILSGTAIGHCLSRALMLVVYCQDIDTFPRTREASWRPGPIRAILPWAVYRLPSLFLRRTCPSYVKSCSVRTATATRRKK